LRGFLKTCKIAPDLEIQAGTLFAAYEQFCWQEGVPQVLKSIHSFSPLMQAHGFKKVRRTTGVFFQGLGL